MKTARRRSAAKSRARILIVDDHPITRHGLSQLIGQESDLTVCGEAANSAQALSALASSKPDLALLDLTIPGRNGLEFIKDLRVQHPQVAVLVLSMHDEALYADRVLQAGARGYIMKSEGGEKLLKAVRQVLAGQVYLSEKMSARILDVFAGRKTRAAHSQFGPLTDRELDVFQLIGQGFSTREIAQQLNLSTKTVETHRMHIKEKLRLQNGADLTKSAIRWVASRELI